MDRGRGIRAAAEEDMEGGVELRCETSARGEGGRRRRGENLFFFLQLIFFIFFALGWHAALVFIAVTLVFFFGKTLGVVSCGRGTSLGVSKMISHLVAARGRLS